MLHNTLKMIKLVIPVEAETGNAGEQPVRNSPVVWNGLGAGYFPASYLKSFLTFMPKKTHCFVFVVQSLIYCSCLFYAGAVQEHCA